VSIHDPPRQRAIGHVEHEGPEVLVEDRHSAAGPRDAHHLVEDPITGGHVEEDRDRERDVERHRREGQREAVAVTERRPSAGVSDPHPPPCHREERAARIDPNGSAAGAHSGGDIARHDARSAADVQHAHPGPDLRQRQERPAETRLVRLAASGFEDPCEPPGVRLPVDRAVWIGGPGHGRVHRASPLVTSARRTCRRRPRCRSIGSPARSRG
jgi:hypothetical protein